MRREQVQRSASMLGATDLTIVAPIKKGFVPSLDAVTYKTRVKRVLKSLHLGRTTNHEYDFTRALSDVVERVGRIHSVRIAVLEPEDKVLLAVTFDGSWESYIRVIWQKAARSLDLVFCNTEGYVTGWDHSFEEWCAWLRASQAEAPFLYATPGLTYQDTKYLRAVEHRWRRGSDLSKADLETNRFRILSAEEIADKIRRRGIDPGNMGSDEALDLQVASRPAFRQGVRSLAALFRLSDVYLPGTDDGRILHRATLELLREFVQMVSSDSSDEYQAAIEFAKVRFRDALDWLRNTPFEDRKLAPPPTQIPPGILADVQGGILEAYPDVRYGCLLLLGFDDRPVFAEFLDRICLTPADCAVGDAQVTVNLALTLEGLRMPGLSDQELGCLPGEFVQGMEHRAGVLGDVRANHPRRWRLPALNASDGIGAAEASETDAVARVDLSAVHALLNLRLCSTDVEQPAARKRLWDHFLGISSGFNGLRLLSVQWMHSLRDKTGVEREHFGYVHTDFAPAFRAEQKARKYPNQVHLGEVLLGHETAADALPTSGSSSKEVAGLLRNGSFLVVRKLRQDSSAFHAAVERGVDQLIDNGIMAAGDLRDRSEVRALLMAKMMGRWPLGSGERTGLPLANATDGKPDDFTYVGDKDGSLCPFHAHVRLANPRESAGVYFSPAGARPPRLVRRGMAYGAVSEDTRPPQSESPEHGLVFIAYNSSIGEQFEVVQGWLTGGNGSGTYSGNNDVFMGVPEPGRPRTFRFEHGGRVYRVNLDEARRLDQEPQPFVRLEWGTYAFSPSLSAVKVLAARARLAGTLPVKSWSAVEGLREIAALKAVELERGAEAALQAWKEVLEDPSASADFRAASVWAAIREHHGGVLKTPFGVLVASRRLVSELLHDESRSLSVCGYMPRMERSFGPMYLGMDAHEGTSYEVESAPVNAAIMSLTDTRTKYDAAVRAAADVTIKVIDRLREHSMAQALEEGVHQWDLTFDVREVTDMVLAHFCESWFGLSEKGGHFEKSGLRLTWRPPEPPCYPGHFVAPSRYMFWPHPGPDVERIAAEHGRSVRAGMAAYLAEFAPEVLAPVARAILDAVPAQSDGGFAARTLAGVLMGFVPTVDGNMRRIADEWLKEGTLWRLRARSGTGEPAELLGRAIRQEFITAMQLRAAPDLLWRTAVIRHSLGSGPHQVHVRPGEIVVASLVSATQECLETGDPTVEYAFGGRRTQSQPHPAHACPGYGPATAVMLGFFTGLVKYPRPLRRGPAPLTLSMEGTTEESAGGANVR